MSDYSFMRTGRNIQPQNTPIDPDRIMRMITLFIRNGNDICRILSPKKT